VAAGVLAEHERVLFSPTVGRVHDLVGRRSLSTPSGGCPGLVRERVRRRSPCGLHLVTRSPRDDRLVPRSSVVAITATPRARRARVAAASASPRARRSRRRSAEPVIAHSTWRQPPSGRRASCRRRRPSFLGFFSSWQLQRRRPHCAGPHVAESSFEHRLVTRAATRSRRCRARYRARASSRAIWIT